MRATPSIETTEPDGTVDAHEHDLRTLPCPQPLEIGLALARTLAPGQSVRLLTPQRPTPLLELLAAQGLQTEVFILSGGDACVHIRRPVHDGQAGR